MKWFLKILIISIFVLSSCKSKEHVSKSTDATHNSNDSKKGGEILSFSINEIGKVDKAELMYMLKAYQINDELLELKVQYGGGCVKPHVFELVSDGVIKADGYMDFYLLHKTKDDMCKALLIEDLQFELHSLYDLKSDRLVGIRLNDRNKISLK